MQHHIPCRLTAPELKYRRHTPHTRGHGGPLHQPVVMAQPADNVDADFADLEHPVVMAQPADQVDAEFADLEIGHAVTVKGG